MFAIFSIDPGENDEEVFTIVEIFDTKEDAEFVLSALEKVNISYNVYRIVEIGV